MSRTIDGITVWPLRTLPKDIGVAALVAVALILGLVLRLQVEGRMKQYENADPSFSVSYPATWRVTQAKDGALLRLENPQTDSAYKTNMTVESRELDPASPPTIQDLADRRIVQHGALTGYHLLANTEQTINGVKGARLEYAYLIQPIDTPRSAVLPVVVHCREYILATRDRTYYFALAAPENDFARAVDQFERIVEKARIQ
jgi:hypothetical protein